MKIKLLASAIVAGTMFSSIAMADVVSGGSGTIGQAQTSWESNGATGGSSTAAIPNVETAINFSAFDSALGTLTSVTFDYSYNVLGDLTITNTGTSSLTYTDVSVKPLIQYDLFNDATTAGDVEAFHNDSIVLFTSAFGTTLANNGDFDTYIANETNSGSLTVSTNLDSFLTAFDFGCSADV
ncbi:MAG: choice-of-anchor E domain-containing protein, partial [Gammaproteobacteria bacterium]|nr:choice-of-anchor E domain-containing protein [Gammaproteobacteria bacterium]